MIMAINLFHTTKIVYRKICCHRSCPWRLAEQLEFAPYGSFHTSFVGIPRSMCCHHVTRTGCRQMQSPWLWFQVVFSAFNYVWMLCCCWECKCFRHDSSWQQKQFEKSFHARFQPRIQRYGQIFPYARNAFAGSNLTPTKKTVSQSVHDDFAWWNRFVCVFF